MIVCDYCRRYATTCCRNCVYEDTLRISITGDYPLQWISKEDAEKELREMYPEDFHGIVMTKIIRAYRFIARRAIPFLLYEKWTLPRQFDTTKYYPTF